MTRERRINPNSAAKLLAHTEFTTWYTKGFARRLMEENIDLCKIYRAEIAQNPRCECTKLEEKIIQVKKIYDGHLEQNTIHVKILRRFQFLVDRIVIIQLDGLCLKMWFSQ